MIGNQKSVGAEPVARMVSSTAVETVWLVTLPRPRAISKVYIATTYPESERITVQSSFRMRPIANALATHLVPRIRTAITKAAAAFHGPGAPMTHMVTMATEAPESPRRSPRYAP